MVAETMKQAEKLRRSAGIRAGAAVLALLSALASANAQEAWHYVLNVSEPARQANFCSSEADVTALVGIFERFGPRTGYAALAESEGCFIAVLAFTPLRIVEEIIIAEGKPEEYRMRFVEVHNPDGKVFYLVTTREVHAE